MATKTSRIKFIGFIGLALASLFSTNNPEASEKVVNCNDLNGKQKDFLVQYAGWLRDLEYFIRLQQQGPGNTENNKKLRS